MGQFVANAAAFLQEDSIAVSVSQTQDRSLLTAKKHQNRCLLLLAEVKEVEEKEEDNEKSYSSTLPSIARVEFEDRPLLLASSSRKTTADKPQLYLFFQVFLL